MASKGMIPFLVGMMLLTGVCNTLLTKYQDNQCVRNCEDPDIHKRKNFEQPVLQTAQMFVGEMGCWLVVGLLKLYTRWTNKISPAERGYEALNTTPDAADRAIEDGDDDDDDDDDQRKPVMMELRGKKIMMLALPAICDICGTTLMNVGLLLVAASIYQMTRGALVLFVGLFSVLFLKRKLHLFQWLSLVGVVLGVAVVGLSGFLWPDAKAPQSNNTEADAERSSALLALIGFLLIAGAQIFTATQFVVEEWILERYSIEPLKVVGWEGIFGLIFTVLGMVILHAAVGRTDAGRLGPFDMIEGWRQMTTQRALGTSSILIMFSIGSFNFFGLSVTRSVSATSRSTIDTCRTLFIWLASLGLGWERFKWLQIVGFALLVYATFVFNGVVHPPLECLKPKSEVEELLPEEPIEAHR
ncbi:hypothetical protein NLU13_6890 [Sarocladium strictum]|uniref:Integral membrane protein n=1 Tax=Sarocladium strictum TaxID=5046 RepID=A0AA39L689_SARSR|nr:hypothetical protein NLU13_6890 [Sarocladium strictum]